MSAAMFAATECAVAELALVLLLWSTSSFASRRRGRGGLHHCCSSRHYVDGLAVMVVSLAILGRGRFVYGDSKC
jgi:hypothetical protein